MSTGKRSRSELLISTLPIREPVEGQASFQGRRRSSVLFQVSGYFTSAYPYFYICSAISLYELYFSIACSKALTTSYRRTVRSARLDRPSPREHWPDPIPRGENPPPIPPIRRPLKAPTGIRQDHRTSLYDRARVLGTRLRTQRWNELRSASS